MISLRRRFALTFLAGCVSLGVLASSSVFAQEADESAVVEAPELVTEEAPAIEFDPIAAEPIVEAPALEPAVLPLMEPTPVPAAPALAAANKLDISVVDNRFQPTALTIAPGTTVTWTNNGNNIHTLTSPDGGFDSGGLLGGDSFSFTFAKAGTYRLVCRQHGLNGMFGQIVVQ